MAVAGKQLQKQEERQRRQGKKRVSFADEGVGGAADGGGTANDVNPAISDASTAVDVMSSSSSVTSASSEAASSAASSEEEEEETLVLEIDASMDWLPPKLTLPFTDWIFTEISFCKPIDYEKEGLQQRWQDESSTKYDKKRSTSSRNSFIMICPPTGSEEEENENPIESMEEGMAEIYDNMSTVHNKDKNGMIFYSHFVVLASPPALVILPFLSFH